MNRLHRALQRPLRAADLPVSERILGILVCVLLLSAPIVLLSLLIMYTYYRHFYTHSLILPCRWAARRRTKHALRSKHQLRSFTILAHSDPNFDEPDLLLKYFSQLGLQHHNTVNLIKRIASHTAEWKKPRTRYTGFHLQEMGN